VAGLRIRRICVVVIAFLLACGLQAQTVSPQLSLFRDDSRVTPVSGESWLIHLNRSFGDTNMGKTGRLGPGPQEDSALQQEPQTPISSSRDGVTVHGSDLYRLNCQACHGESGLGAPPEINSVINPVRATSVPLVLSRMKNAGMGISYGDATKLAQQSKAALLLRLHQGGENMPAFPQLNEVEIRALLAYLKHLADVPGAASEQSAVKESHVRVGELIVKSTCHTCHSAVGDNPGPLEMMEGAIPPLSTLTARKHQSDFIRKVTLGAPVLMGAPPALCRGRMPVFFYLSEEEAADVYLYLSLYPPSDRTSINPIIATTQLVRPSSGNGRGPGMTVLTANLTTPEETESTETAAVEMVALALLATFVTAVLAGGLYFTFREFKRLSGNGAGHAVVTRDLPVPPGMSGDIDAINGATGPLAYRRAKGSSSNAKIEHGG
jgi:mono/diheme cytochrome c family protein